MYTHCRVSTVPFDSPVPHDIVDAQLTVTCLVSVSLTGKSTPTDTSTTGAVPGPTTLRCTTPVPWLHLRVRSIEYETTKLKAWLSSSQYNHLHINIPAQFEMNLMQDRCFSTPENLMETCQAKTIEDMAVNIYLAQEEGTTNTTSSRFAFNVIPKGRHSWDMTLISVNKGTKLMQLE